MKNKGHFLSEEKVPFLFSLLQLTANDANLNQKVGPIFLAASHAVAAIQALVASAVANRRVTAAVAWRCIPHHFGEV
jgi:hypothetical protein